jgi:hypothetical protein
MVSSGQSRQPTMPTETQPPRRKWNITRWLLVFALVALAWSGWRAYAFRSALAQAKALGWTVEYTEPFETIRADWKAAFKKETWLDGVRLVSMREVSEQHFDIVYRLNPKTLWLRSATDWRDLSVLKPLTRLESLSLGNCGELTSIDALKDFSALRTVSLDDCTRLTNVDALTNLRVLKNLALLGCKGLTNVDPLKDLSTLQRVNLDRTGLTNVDALKNLSDLKGLSLWNCTGLTNLDGLKNLSALREVKLTGCTGLTAESIAALKAALPKVRIYPP